MVYVNKIGNRITFQIKTEYYLELLTPETMKLLGSTKSKIITKGENGENAPRLKITEVVFSHCNIFTMIMDMIQESCIHLFLINHLLNY